MTLIEKIRNLVADGQTEKSIEELLDYVKSSDNELLDRIILLKSRMHDLNEKVFNGTIDENAASLQRARINEAVLKILHEITPPYLGPTPPTPPRPASPPATQSSSKNWIIWLVLAAFIFIGGWYFFQKIYQTGVSSDVQVRLELPRFEHNVNRNGNMHMKIWQPGHVTGAKGRIGYVVVNFMMNGQFLKAKFDEVSYKNPYGNVATTTGPISIGTNDHDLGQDTMYIPYTAFNLISTGGQTTYTLHLYTEIFLESQVVKYSSSQEFYVNW